MATQATLMLRSLTCLQEWDADGHSEPYLWPVYFHIDAVTMVVGARGGDYIHLYSPLAEMPGPTLNGLDLGLGASGIGLFPGGVQAGAVLAVPSPIAHYHARFDVDNAMAIGVVVALIEHDDMSDIVMATARQAFEAELLAQLNAFFGSLAELRGPTPNEYEAMKDKIEDRANDAAHKAAGAATKFSVFLGWQRADSFIAAGTKTFQRTGARVRVGAGVLPGPRPAPGSLPAALGDEFATGTRQFDIELRGTSSITVPFGPTVVYPQHYTLHGDFDARPYVPTNPDPCQGFVDAVRSAQQIVDNYQKLIDGLLAQLHQTSTSEGPAPSKATIRAQIAATRSGPLENAIASLTASLTDLQACRAARSAGGPA
jgi:hypothetical protein